MLYRTVKRVVASYKQAMNAPNDESEKRSSKAWAEVPDRHKHKREEVPTLESDDDGVESVYERQEALQNVWHKNTVR